MSNNDLQAAQDALGAQQAISGPIAGFGVHSVVESADFSDKPVATLKVDEASVARAEAASGADKLPSSVPKASGAMAKATNYQNKADAQYAGMFKGARLADVDRALSRGPNFGSRPNYNAAFAAQPKGPLARFREQRRLMTLRRTFDQIRNQPRKSVAVNPESLSQAALKHMAEAAIAAGKQMTPAGSLVQTMKLAGMKPKAAGPKKRQWALFFNPEMVPSGYATD
jgi:hypothetical protein